MVPCSLRLDRAQISAHVEIGVMMATSLLRCFLCVGLSNALTVAPVLRTHSSAAGISRVGIVRADEVSDWGVDNLMAMMEDAPKKIVGNVRRLTNPTSPHSVSWSVT